MQRFGSGQLAGRLPLGIEVLDSWAHAVAFLRVVIMGTRIVAAIRTDSLSSLVCASSTPHNERERRNPRGSACYRSYVPGNAVTFAP